MIETAGKKFAVLSRDAIKYLAILTMTLNHVAAILMEPGTLWYDMMVSIGYFTAFAMCSFLVEGYDHTRSKKRYAQRLLLFAAVSEIPFCLAFTKNGICEFKGMNMIFTLFICFCLIHADRKMASGGKKTAVMIGLVLVTAYSDWGLLAPMITALFLAGQTSDQQRKRSWCIAVLIFGIISMMERAENAGLLAGILYGTGCMIGPALAGICILFLYNGKRGKGSGTVSKWFFYLFYPTHLLILGLLRIYLK